MTNEQQNRNREIINFNKILRGKYYDAIIEYMKEHCDSFTGKNGEERRFIDPEMDFDIVLPPLKNSNGEEDHIHYVNYTMGEDHVTFETDSGFEYTPDYEDPSDIFRLAKIYEQIC